MVPNPIKKLQVCKYARAVMPERCELATVIYYIDRRFARPILYTLVYYTV